MASSISSQLELCHVLCLVRLQGLCVSAVIVWTHVHDPCPAYKGLVTAVMWHCFERHCFESQQVSLCMSHMAVEAVSDKFWYIIFLAAKVRSHVCEPFFPHDVWTSISLTSLLWSRGPHAVLLASIGLKPEPSWLIT